MSPATIVQRKYYSFVDIVKSICIIFIVIAHFSWDSAERLTYYFPFWVDVAIPIFMIVGGYVNSIAFIEDKLTNWKHLYSYKGVLRGIVRYTVPFAMIYLIEVVSLLFRVTDPARLSDILLVKLFLTGGIGPGSYYYPLMIQFVFLFPLIFYGIYRYNLKGLLFVFALNFLFEIGVSLANMPLPIYNLILVRYFFAIGIGVFIYVRRYHIPLIVLLPPFVMGVAYQLIVYYAHYEPAVITNLAESTLFSMLYIGPVFAFLMRTFRNDEWKYSKAMAYFGKAYFEIFLTQMLFYTFVDEGIGAYITWVPLHLALNIIICLAVGSLFYRMERPITERLMNLVSRSS